MNRIYFICASALFLISCYQVNLAANVITKLQKTIPVQMVGAFKAGCQTIKRASCDKETAAYASDIFSIYSN